MTSSVSPVATKGVSRDYRIPPIPTFVTGSPLPPSQGASWCGSYGDARDEAEDDGWCIVQNTSNTTFDVTPNVMDNIMCSTNGLVGVKHRSETQTGIQRSYVKMNRVFHRIPMTQELRSVALPTSGEVGAVVCVVDLNTYVNGEACTLIEMQHRSISLRDAAYRSRCVIGNGCGEISFTMTYTRFCSLDNLSEWTARMQLTDFVVSDDVQAAGQLVLTVVAEISLARDQWYCADGNTVEHFIVQSHTSGIEVDTKTWAECSVVGHDASSVALVTPHMGENAFRGNDKGPREHFQGAEHAFGVFSSSECDATATSIQVSTDGQSGPAQRHWIGSRNYDITISKRAVPQCVCLTLVCSHVQLPTASDDAFSESSDPQGGTPSSTIGHSQSEARGPQGSATVASHMSSQLVRQRAVLKQFWNAFDVEVDQDELHRGRLTMSLRYGAFVAFCTGAGAARGVAMNALSSPGISMQLNLQHYLYHGIFYVFAAPEAAQRLMRHLIALLPQARDHARRMSLSKGALFPHSTISGEECGSYFLTSSPRYHINADLAYVVLLYLESSGSAVQPAERVALVELLLEIARVWLEIGEWQQHQTEFRIDEVSGPDDYGGLVEANFYTLLSVKSQLNHTVAMVRKLLKAPASTTASRNDVLTHSFRRASTAGGVDVREVMERIQMSDAELDEIERAAGAITLHRDDRSGVYYAHEHFDSLKEWTGRDLNYPLFLNYHPLVVYRHKLCEIPEVLLGMLMHPQTFELPDIARNLKYYEPLCTHDTPESLAVIAATRFRAFGDVGKGMPLLEAVAQLDLDNITYTAEEGLHLSAMTASWMAVVFGIGGLRIVDGTMHMYPSLPVGVERVAFTVHWHAAAVKVVITAEQVVYELLQGANFRLIHFDHTRVHLHEGKANAFSQQLSVCIPRTVVQQMTAHFDGVVFTMEALIENLLDINFLAWSRVLNPFLEEAAAHNQRLFEPFTMDEYITRMVYQEGTGSANFSGLQRVLAVRGVDLELGTPLDMELVPSRYGLANAKVEELRVIMRQETLRLVPGVLDLLTDLKQLGLRVALVSYTRSMYDVLNQLPPLVSELFTTMIDGAEAREKQLRARPHTDLFVRAAQKMHIPTKRCIVCATHLDRGYRDDDIQAFLSFMNVQEPRTTELRSKLVFGGSDTSSLSDSPRRDAPSSSGFVIHIDQQHMPSSTAELEDAIIGATMRRSSFGA